MTEAFIVDAVRTAVGKRGGGFADEHPADMAAHVIRTLVERHDRLTGWCRGVVGEHFVKSPVFEIEDEASDRYVRGDPRM